MGNLAEEKEEQKERFVFLGFSSFLECNDSLATNTPRTLKINDENWLKKSAAYVMK